MRQCDSDTGNTYDHVDDALLLVADGSAQGSREAPRAGLDKGHSSHAEGQDITSNTSRRSSSFLVPHNETLVWIGSANGVEKCESTACGQKVAERARWPL